MRLSRVAGVALKVELEEAAHLQALRPQPYKLLATSTALLVTTY